MPIRFGRMVTAAVAIEAIAILALVLLVAMAGPSDPAAAQAFAERVGYWFGPAAGFILTLAGGWLVTRDLPAHRLLNGLALGAAVAAIDVSLLVAMGSEFQLVFVASNLGRLAAGTAGAWLAGPAPPRKLG